MPPRGPVSYAYLNNPKLILPEHWLTEIRIPVDQSALRVAGTLGEMVDVKKLPAMQVAMAVKPEGMADPAEIYSKLIVWMHRNNYAPVDGFFEIFLTNTMSGDYAKMQSQIMAPIVKLDMKSTN